MAMIVERKINPEDSAAFARLLRAAFESLDDIVSIEWMGQSFELERVSDVEFAVRKPGEAGGHRVVCGSATRPADYPAGLPYLPDEVVMFDVSALVRAATWWSISDQSLLFAELERQCLETGWEKETGSAISDAEFARCTCRRAGAVRHLMSSQGIVSLVERPVGKAG